MVEPPARRDGAEHGRARRRHRGARTRLIAAHENQQRPFFRGFPAGTEARPCHAAHADGPATGRSTWRSTVRSLRAANPRPTASRVRWVSPASPLDDLLVFHTVFGKSVPDISLNAVANLGYAEGRFLKPVYPGATLSADLGSDRPQGEFEPGNRRRLCAHGRSGHLHGCSPSSYSHL